MFIFCVELLPSDSDTIDLPPVYDMLEELKKNPFGHYLILKKWLIRYMGFMTHRRYRGFNKLKIEGSEIIKSLPDKNVLFI